MNNCTNFNIITSSFFSFYAIVNRKSFNRKSYLWIFVCFLPIFSKAQSVLSLEEAVETALRQSYAIEASKIQEKVAQIQIYKGNAGFAPRLDWNTNVGTAFNEVNQKLSNGTEINRFGRSLAPVSNLAFSWNLYGGNRNPATLERLKNQSQLSHLQTTVLSENIVLNVMRAYYEVMRQKQTVKYLETVIKFYKERLKITEERWQFGKGSKLDFLQSKTDLVTQEVERVRAKNALRNAKINLNNAMNREPNTDFDVLEALPNTFEPDLADLKNKLQTNNKNLQLLRKNRDISGIVQREVEMLKKPRLTLNSTLGYNLNTTNAGLFLYNQNIGLNTGLTLSWNLFNGEQTRRQIQTAKINTEIIQKQQLDLLSNLESDLIMAHNQYLSDRELLVLEEENIKVVEENLQISLEKFKLGGSSILEINEAQRRFDLASNRLVNARFNVIISELEFLRLSGELGK